MAVALPGAYKPKRGPMPKHPYGKPTYFTGDEPYAPQEFTAPLSPDAPSDGPRAIEMAKRLHKRETGEILQLDDYQTKLICSILEKYDSDHALAGQYRFKESIVSIPRRNGKSTVASVLAQFSLIISSAPTIGVLASTKEQAKEVFDSVKYNFENNPILKERYKTTQGKGIESRRPDKPAHFKIYAGNGDSLQGITFYAIIPVIVDELHITKEKAYDAAVKGASIGDCGPVIGITTAGTDSSELLKRLYVVGRNSIAKGEDYDERFGFWHWFVPEETELWDRDALLAANPAAYFGRIDIDREILKGKQNPSNNYMEYRRYRRNEFVHNEEIWLSLDKWATCAGRGIPADEKENIIVSVDRDPFWKWATITANKKIDGIVYSTAIARVANPTLELLAVLCNSLFDSYGVDSFVMPPGLRDLKDILIEQHGLTAKVLSEIQLSLATNMVAKMVADKRIVHNASPTIKQQLPKTVATVTAEGVKININKSSGTVEAVRATVIGIYEAERLDNDSANAFVF